MKRVLLGWFLLIIICYKALPYSSSASTLTSKAGYYKHLEKEKQLIKNGYGSKVIKAKIEDGSGACKGKGLQEVLHLGNVKQRGKKAIFQLKKANKGVYGGGDLLRPRSKKGGASSSVLKSSSIALWTVALGLIFVMFF